MTSSYHRSWGALNLWMILRETRYTSDWLVVSTDIHWGML